MIIRTKYKNNFEEKLLNFKEAYLGIFYSFSMEGIKNFNLDRDSAKNKINNNYKRLSKRQIADWNDNWDYAKLFKYAEEFLLKRLPEDRIRIKLDAHVVNNSEDQLTIEAPFPTDDKPDRRLSMPVEIFLSIYPSNEIGTLFFHIKFPPNNQERDTISTDDLIFAIHSLFEDRFKIKLHIPNYLKKPGTNNKKLYIMDEIIKMYEDFVYDAFGINNMNKQTGYSVKKRILEICDSGDGLNLFSTEEFLLRYPRQAYGLMAGDEGWSYVPKAFCRSRIENRWGSRDFVSIIASSDGVVSLNFKNTLHHDAYKKMQKKLKDDRKETVEPYLNHDYAIAGMDHGSFLCLEKAVLTKLILNRHAHRLSEDIISLKNETERFKKQKILKKNIIRIRNKFFVNIDAKRNLNRISEELNELYFGLNQISLDNKKWELDMLYKNISKALELDMDLEDIINKIEDRKEYFNQLHSLASNNLMTKLTIYGLGSAFASVGLTVITILLAIIALYLSGAQIYLDLPGHNCTAALGDHFLRWEGRIVNETFNGHIWNWIWNSISSLMPK